MAPPLPHEKELLTPGGVAAMLFVDPKTVTRWAVAGKLSSIRTPGGHRRYLRSDVVAIMDGLHPLQVAAQLSPVPAQNPAPGSETLAVVPAPREGSPVDPPETDHDGTRQAAAAAVVAEAVAVALE